jgi:hypothetical protein
MSLKKELDDLIVEAHNLRRQLESADTTIVKLRAKLEAKRDTKKGKAMKETLAYRHMNAIRTLVELVQNNCDDLVTHDEADALSALKDFIETAR